MANELVEHIFTNVFRTMALLLMLLMLLMLMLLMPLKQVILSLSFMYLSMSSQNRTYYEHVNVLL